MERNTIFTVFFLMFMLGLVNAAMGGPRSLPSLPPHVSAMVPWVCGGGALVLLLVLLVDSGTAKRREDRKDEERQHAAWQKREAIRLRKKQLAEDPAAPPETYAEQIERKKHGL